MADQDSDEPYDSWKDQQAEFLAHSPGAQHVALRRLEAAAPDLLAACRLAADFFTQSLSQDDVTREMLIKTLATLADAIRKAEGSA